MKRITIWMAVLVLLGASAAQGASVPQGAYATQGASLTWTWQNPRPQANDLFSVAYGGGLFVAVGDGGSILTSTDGGTSWTLQQSPTMAPLRSVIYAKDRFVAVGGRMPPDGKAGADQVILTSTDGLTWAAVQTGDGPALSDVAYGDGRFVAVGGCGWPALSTGRSVLTSADGVT